MSLLKRYNLSKFYKGPSFPAIMVKLPLEKTLEEGLKELGVTLLPRVYRGEQPLINWNPEDEKRYDLEEKVFGTSGEREVLRMFDKAENVDIFTRKSVPYNGVYVNYVASLVYGDIPNTVTLSPQQADKLIKDKGVIESVDIMRDDDIIMLFFKDSEGKLSIDTNKSGINLGRLARYNGQPYAHQLVTEFIVEFLKRTTAEIYH